MYNWKNNEVFLQDTGNICYKSYSDPPKKILMSVSNSSLPDEKI